MKWLTKAFTECSWLLCLVPPLLLSEDVRQFYLARLHWSFPMYWLLMLYLALVLIWVLFTPNDLEREGYLVKLLNELFPLMLLMLALFAQYRPYLAALLVLTLAVVYLVFCGAQRWFRRRYASRLLRRKQRRKQRRVRRRVLVITAAVLFAVPCQMVLFEYGMHGWQLSAKAERYVLAAQETPQFLHGFRQEEWQNCSAQQKLELAQMLADSETTRLGLPPLDVVVYKEAIEQAPDAIYQKAGHYDHQRRQIFIAEELLRDAKAENVANTVCHEVFHCYQWQMIDCLEADPTLAQSSEFAVVRQWQQERMHYITSDGTQQGHEAYAVQSVERSAREYAAQRVRALLAEE